MREKLIEFLNDARMNAFWHRAKDPIEYIADMLIANGVTIPVRCKDCKHWSDGVHGCTDNVKCCKIGYYMVGGNGYCVYGERKDNGNTTDHQLAP